MDFQNGGHPGFWTGISLGIFDLQVIETSYLV